MYTHTHTHTHIYDVCMCVCVWYSCTLYYAVICNIYSLAVSLYNAVLMGGVNSKP